MSARFVGSSLRENYISPPRSGRGARISAIVHGRHIALGAAPELRRMNEAAPSIGTPAQFPDDREGEALVFRGRSNRHEGGALSPGAGRHDRSRMRMRCTVWIGIGT